MPPPSESHSFDFPSQLSATLRELGVARGDVLMVHSAAGRMLKANGANPAQIIEGLLDCVMPDGTLLLPTNNFGWCSGKPFDYHGTPSETGVITEMARKDPRFVRTFHPIYSFAVTGAQLPDFTAYDYPSSYGVGSVFDLLHRMDGKILVIGMPWMYAVTSFHYVEEMEKVPYRFHKSFAGDYRDRDGRWSRREYFMYARRVEQGVVTNVGHVEGALISEGLASELESLGTRFTLIRAQVFYERVSARLRKDPMYLHRIEKP